MSMRGWRSRNIHYGHFFDSGTNNLTRHVRMLIRFHFSFFSVLITFFNSGNSHPMYHRQRPDNIVI